MPHLSLTTWSLHRELGPLKWTYWDENESIQKTRIEEQPENMALLDLPHELSKQNFRSLEICHFHFPSTEPEYLHKLNDVLAKSGITFQCLLVDYGDISNADSQRRSSDIEFIKKWIDVAAIAGAKSVRVIAGEANPHNKEAIQLAKNGFQQLAEYAKPKGIMIVTENFKQLASTKENCLELLNSNKEQLGLTVDFGNFSPQEKYHSIETLMPYAESVHAKANYDKSGQIDESEYKKSLDLVASSGYKGPITLVYDGPGSLWDGINRIKAIAEQYCH
ncbi:xylose isomerase [Bacillus sp. SA1-12]|uniref:sugar phosphate isomerase/epimerase family protein n=1 Tax=Bacillus sp. SA1-12 TaxID=1455638 RepID=UPI000626F4DC|nr:TIM barrel protein [Bacillus sp. SA1-12]KKI90349.1 xylose isomerase [Bacillus sp. SA1-12]